MVDGTDVAEGVQTQAEIDAFGLGNEESDNQGDTSAVPDPTGEAAPDPVTGESELEVGEQQSDVNWKEQYQNLESALGRQGQELGELRKLKADFDAYKQSQLSPEAKDDPWQAPLLKELQPAQKDFMVAIFDAYLQDKGFDLSKIPNMEQSLAAQGEMFQKQVLDNEIARTIEKVGKDNWKAYVPKMQGFLDKNPNFGGTYEQLYKVVAFEDKTSSVKEGVQRNREQRAERAAQADMGKTGPKSAPTTNGELLNNIMKNNVSNRDAFRALVSDQEQ